MKAEKGTPPEAPGEAQRCPGVRPSCGPHVYKDTKRKVARQASREKLAEEASKAILPAQARLLLRWLEEPLETVKVRGRHSYQLQLTMTIAPDRLPSGLDLSLREAKKAGEFLAGLRLAVFELRQGLLHIMTAEVDDRIKSGELVSRWRPPGCGAAKPKRDWQKPKERTRRPASGSGSTASTFPGSSLSNTRPRPKAR